MNTDALCPDCGAQFDTTVEYNVFWSALKIYRCGNCGNFIYRFEYDEDEPEDEIEE